MNPLSSLGILLAGESGTRLEPLTRALSKQLLPVYDKPFVYYLLSTPVLAGLREALVITAPRDRPAFEALLGERSEWGLELRYAEQDWSRGIARVRDHGGVPPRKPGGATVLVTHVHDPEPYGVVVLDRDGRPVALKEEPTSPRSGLAVTGLYFHDAPVCRLAHAAAELARGLVPAVADAGDWLR